MEIGGLGNLLQALGVETVKNGSRKPAAACLQGRERQSFAPVNGKPKEAWDSLQGRATQLPRFIRPEMLTVVNGHWQVSQVARG